jgi:hypothetical protein
MSSASLGTFFWLSAVYFYMKYSMDLPVYAEVLFLMVVIIFMYFINVSVMQSKCSSVNSTVFKATFLPWVFMFGSMVIALLIFPQWKNPFSNTFGYIIARLAGGTQSLLNLLRPGSETSLRYVYDNPSLLINQFTPLNFDVVLEGFKNELVITEENKENFRKIVKLKDVVAEWIWYLLTASVVISTSYTMMMNAECTKSADEYVLSHNIAMAETQEDTPVSMYTITE